MKTIVTTALILSGLTPTLALADDWQIISVNGEPAQGMAELHFAADGGFAGNTGCNGFQGTGRMDGADWVVDSPIAATRKACAAPGVMEQENAILRLFSGPVSLIFDPTGHEMILLANGVVATLLPALATDADGLTGTENSPRPLPNDAAYLDVYGVSGKLNIRAEPSTDSQVVGKVLAGTLLVNDGCEAHGGRDWCKIKMLGGATSGGWAAAEYLEPATASLRAQQGVFDDIGRLDCAIPSGEEVAKCDFGITRDLGGSAVLTVFRPNGTTRMIYFVDGDLAYARDAGEGRTLTARGVRGETRYRAEVGEDVYEIDISHLGLD